jgi:hypothetical protein
MKVRDFSKTCNTEKMEVFMYFTVKDLQQLPAWSLSSYVPKGCNTQLKNVMANPVMKFRGPNRRNLSMTESSRWLSHLGYGG